ncbi:MAG TPA: phenylalanine--tRNA ligase subunit beta [Bacteroidia bacterium]|nr:phenylalanine--tRNA ligase subunit beta [Bacteroidia bacterium]HNP98788.1 phenylalanine--tRNA ligase subunit beta [Bacteroidia bacterium]
MKISYNWLKKYLPVTLPAGETAHLLTHCGLEVEGIESFQSMKGGLEGLFVGEVKTCTKHPNADKLSLTTVDTGDGTLLSIVCGAPNIAAGQKVIVAKVGATLYPVTGEPFEIKKSKIRGELSEGMICAEDEIGLGTSHAGVMVLPQDTRIGMPAAEYFKIENDQVFEIGLTPNRADAASHLGVARDLYAVLINKSSTDTSAVPPVTRVAVDTFTIDSNALPVKVEVQDPIACPRYSAITISGVQVGESPEWLKNRLRSIGVGPINNIVDITNFVLHECGQPLHAFDAAAIKGNKVVVRSAREGEKFVTLDQVERTLVLGNLMICDEEKPMCLAGVFGGIGSGISNTTTNVFLESAYFNPASIRKTSKLHGLKTDASFRFERGTDPEMTLYALKRAALLIREIAGGKISSEIIDIYPEPILPGEIVLNYNYLNRFSGEELDRNKVKKILLALGLEIVSEDAGSAVLRVPTFKVDVTRPVDVVEEILRVYGYNNIPIPKKQNVSLPAIVDFDRDKLLNKVSDYLASNGFNEILSNSLSKSRYTELAGWNAEQNVKVLNPLSQDLEILRRNMLYTGLEAIEYNRNRKHSDLRLFEFGKTYSKEDSKYKEFYHLSLFISGRKSEERWNGDTSPVSFYFLKSYVENLLRICGVGSSNLNTEVYADTFFASGLQIKTGNKVLVTFGSIKKNQLKPFDISNEVFYADFDWDALIKIAGKKSVQYVEVSKFPVVRRDLSMLIDRQVTYAQIEAIAYKTERKLLRELRLFDVYEGEKIEAGKKSYAVTFLLNDDEQTLTEKQIDKTMERLMLALEKEAGAVIRKG